MSQVTKLQSVDRANVEYLKKSVYVCVHSLFPFFNQISEILDF